MTSKERLGLLMLTGVVLLNGCGKKSGKGAGPEAPEDSVEMVLAIPLTPEQATALAGITSSADITLTDDLVVDVFVNDETVAEGVRGGVRAGVRGGVRAGVRGAPRRQSDDESISFQATFFFPKRLAREGDNTLRARVRHRDESSAELVEIKTNITIRGSSDPAQIEILDQDIAMNEVVLPDVDGDGVATLLEAVTLGIAAALDGGIKPTEEQVKTAVEQFAQKLIEEMKRQGLVVAVDISKIDLTPPVGGLGFAPGEVTVGNLPACEAGRTNPATDSVETTEKSATFILCANEPARFQCSLDGANASPCPTPLLLKDLEFGRHALVVIAQDGNGNTQPDLLSFRWVIAPKELPAPSGLNASPGDGGMAVSWVAVPGATGYKVYYGPSSNALTSSVKSTTSATTIGGLENGVQYEVAVAALAGEKEGPKSSPVKVTPVAGAPKILSAPSGVSATPGDGKITLTWAGVAGATGYRVYYGTAKSQLSMTVDVATGTAAEIAGLTNGTTHYFAVTALQESGAESGPSETVSATPSATAVATGKQTCTLNDSAIDACALL